MLIDRLTRSLQFVAYHSSLALGIVMLPFALAARHLGVTLPVHRLIEAAERAYNAR